MPKYKVIWFWPGGRKGRPFWRTVLFDDDAHALAEMTKTVDENPGCSAEVWRPDRKQLVGKIGPV